MSNVSNIKEPRSISIVIRCHNEEEHIGRLLSGITQQTIQNVEIILVDSGSTDATLSIASWYPVKILSISPEEFSFGRSLNIGCREAKGEFVVIASAHVYPMYKDWLERLLTPFQDPQVGLTYGKQRGSQKSNFAEHQVFAKWFPEEPILEQDYPFCNNANAAIRKALWEKIPYNETLTGLEDLDWAKRAMSMGHSIIYVADAEVIHVHEESPSQIYNRYLREAIALKKIYPQERFSLWDFIRHFSINMVSDCYKAVQEKIFWSVLRDVLKFRLMQFWGAYRGFSQYGPVSKQLKRRFYFAGGLERSRSLEQEIDTSRPLVEYSSETISQRTQE
jgi:glycosyltransferase involved in cell wall biosynthesis